MLTSSPLHPTTLARKRAEELFAALQMRPAGRASMRTDDALAQAAMEALLHGVLGYKSDREYRDALDNYNSVTLPRWHRQMSEYNDRYRTREVSWRQEIHAKGAATVTGSLRLVDLVDGLVLWEAPFTGTDQDDSLCEARTAVSTGEDSSPPPPDYPTSVSEPPAALVAKAAETALEQGIQALRGTAVPSS